MKKLIAVLVVVVAVGIFAVTIRAPARAVYPQYQDIKTMTATIYAEAANREPHGMTHTVHAMPEPTPFPTPVEEPSPAW